MRIESWTLLGAIVFYVATCVGTAHAQPYTLRFQNPGTAAYAQLRTPWGVVAAPCSGGATCTVTIDVPRGPQTITAEATVDGVLWSVKSNALQKTIAPTADECLALPSCRFDFDGDGVVTGSDFGAFVRSFNTSWILTP